MGMKSGWWKEENRLSCIGKLSDPSPWHSVQLASLTGSERQAPISTLPAPAWARGRENHPTTPTGIPEAED